MSGRVKGNYKMNGGAFVKQKRKLKVRKKKAESQSRFPPFRPSGTNKTENFLFLFEKIGRAQNLKKM